MAGWRVQDDLLTLQQLLESSGDRDLGFSLVGAGCQVPHDMVVGEGSGEFVAVDDGVVAWAEQGSIVEIGGAAVDP